MKKQYMYISLSSLLLIVFIGYVESIIASPDERIDAIFAEHGMPITPQTTFAVDSINPAIDPTELEAKASRLSLSTEAWRIFVIGKIKPLPFLKFFG